MTAEENSGARRSARRAKSARRDGPIPQLPWRDVQLSWTPIALASEEQVEAIHATSMRILSELGIRVLSPKVMDLFAAAGALVDRATGTIRIDEAIVAEALRTVPERFTLTGRTPSKRLTIGGNHMAFGLVAGPPNVHDCINGRRTGNMKDYENFIRLAHYFNCIHLIGNQVTAPQELSANSRHLDTYRANLTLSDLSMSVTQNWSGASTSNSRFRVLSATTAGLPP